MKWWLKGNMWERNLADYEVICVRDIDDPIRAHDNALGLVEQSHGGTDGKDHPR